MKITRGLLRLRVVGVLHLELIVLRVQGFGVYVFEVFGLSQGSRFTLF